jgi:hypothetical protein
MSTQDLEWLLEERLQVAGRICTRIVRDPVLSSSISSGS